MLLELSGEGKVPFGNFLIRFSSVGGADGQLPFFHAGRPLRYKTCYKSVFFIVLLVI